MVGIFIYEKNIFWFFNLFIFLEKKNYDLLELKLLLLETLFFLGSQSTRFFFEHILCNHNFFDDYNFLKNCKICFSTTVMFITLFLNIFEYLAKISSRNIFSLIYFSKCLNIFRCSRCSLSVNIYL